MNAPSPRLALLALSLALAGAVAAPAAHAQALNSNVTAPTPGGVSGGSTQQSIKGMNQAPTTEILGVPVIVNSPVLTPYNADSTYTTYQGQPANGASAMLAATVQGDEP